MCNFTGNLVAWLDDELAPSEAAKVEQHVRSCSDCSQQVSRFKQVSRDFATYYTGTVSEAKPVVVKSSRRISRWIPAAIAVAAMIVLAIWIAPRTSYQAPAAPVTAKAELPPAPVTAEPAALSPTTAKPAKHFPSAAKRHPVSHPGAAPNDTAMMMSEPTVRIAIPADAIYPPGAVPEGMAYFANVSFAADGSIQALRLER